MATSYVDTPLCNEKAATYWLYCKNMKYNSNSTTGLNHIILNLHVDFVHIYLVVTFSCHSSLNYLLQILVWIQMDPLQCSIFSSASQ